MSYLNLPYKLQLLRQIRSLTYEQAMKELSRNIQLIKGNWDSIVKCDNGKFYKYDHERKHRSKEKYGEEVTGDELNKYLALEHMYNELRSGRIKAGVSTQINL